MLRKPLGDAGEEPFSSWAKEPDDEMVDVSALNMIKVTVTGGETVPVVNVFERTGAASTSEPIDPWR